MERIVSVLWKIEHHESLKELHHWSCHCCYRKSHESYQTWNNKFPLEINFAQMFSITSEDSGESLSKESWKRLWTWHKRWGVVKHFKKILEKSRANRHYTKGIMRRWLDRDECFWISARQWGRRLEYYSKQSTNLMQSLPNYLWHFSQN